MINTIKNPFVFGYKTWINGKLFIEDGELVDKK